MDKEEKKLREEIGSLVSQQESIVNTAKQEKRDFTDEEVTQFNDLQAQIDAKKKALNMHLQFKANKADTDSTIELIEKQDEGEQAGVLPKLSPAQEEKLAMHNLMAKTGQIFSLLASKNIGDESRLAQIGQIQKDMILAGHYGEERRKALQASADGFNTLTDKDGGIFLPTTISERIIDIAEENGVFSRHGLRMPLGPGDGRVKLPNLVGELTFYAVNETQEAKASSMTFSALTLESLKWMTYIPWSNEMDAARGAMLAQIVIRKLGEALARMRDNAIVNGNGTSEYHNKKGFITRSASADHPEVRLSTAANGNNAFAKVTPDDFLTATLDVAKSIRERGRFALDPDWRVFLKQMVDGEKRPHYLSGGPVQVINGEYFVHGYPVDFTEAIPDEDGASKTYGVFYVPEFFAFADNGQFVIEQFNTGSIPNADGTKEINLLSQDMKAARVKTFFDFELSQLTKTYGGTKLGAFTVLRTAS